MKKTLSALVLAGAMAFGMGGCDDGWDRVEATCQVNGMSTSIRYHAVRGGNDKRYICAFNRDGQSILSGKFGINEEMKIICDDNRVLYVKNGRVYVRPVTTEEQP
ncbi:hypothetical protein GOV03_00455 [Candidatus Woesearchaeota archaeon]|nr:hypothetical protein [Candidatus Woesearchaeota archaeon]